MLHHIRMFEHCVENEDIVFANVAELIVNYRYPGPELPDVPHLFLALRECEVVVLHYSLLSLRTLGVAFWAVKARLRWLEKLEGILVAIPQDEGDYYEVLDDWLNQLQVQFIYSVHYRPERLLYPKSREHARIHECLPGYIDTRQFEGVCRKPFSERSTDIFYRARELPYWYGAGGRWKGQIAHQVLNRPAFAKLSLDVSTDDSRVVTGRKWLSSLADAKATLGAPGGYTVLDKRGEVKVAAHRILRQEKLDFDEFCALMPRDWNRVNYLTLTPRHLEAAMAGTVQILVKADYKGLMAPNEHYIPVARDFSNLDEVAERFQDVQSLEAMADRVYSSFRDNAELTYHSFANRILSDVMNDPTRPQSKSDEGKSTGNMGLQGPIQAGDEQMLVAIGQLEVTLDRLVLSTDQATVGVNALTNQVTAAVNALTNQATAAANALTNQATAVSALTKALKSYSAINCMADAILRYGPRLVRWGIGIGGCLILAALLIVILIASRCGL